jgi:hypothetical protein
MLIKRASYDTCRLDRLIAAALVLLMIVGPLTGCGSSGLPGTVPIRGKVVYNGRPLSQGEVRYVPVDPQVGRQARGKLDKNGNFEMTTLKAGDGVLPGKYKVVIVALAPHPGEPGRTAPEPGEAPRPLPVIKRGSLVPERYTIPRATPFEETVDKNHSGYKELVLED